MESIDTKMDFMELVKKYMTIAKDAILNRFEYQCKGLKDSFANQFDLYVDGDKTKDGDLYEALKHGSLSLGFIGLYEAMYLLGEDMIKDIDKAYGYIQEMRNMVDNFAEEYDLNFTLLATPAEGYCYKSFNNYKKAYPNNLPHNKGYFTNSFHVPVWEEINIFEKIKIEAPFHKLCNAGHISYFELGSSAENNIDGIEKIIDYAVENGIGYFSLNHNRQECQNPDCNASYAVSVEDEGKPCRYCGGETEMIAIITGSNKGSFSFYQQSLGSI